jgi:hypothetical protein
VENRFASASELCTPQPAYPRPHIPKTSSPRGSTVAPLSGLLAISLTVVSIVTEIASPSPL